MSKRKTNAPGGSEAKRIIVASLPENGSGAFYVVESGRAIGGFNRG